jgi:hypothetical protein
VQSAEVGRLEVAVEDGSVVGTRLFAVGWKDMVKGEDLWVRGDTASVSATLNTRRME